MAPWMNGDEGQDKAYEPQQAVRPSGIRVVIVGAGFAGITAAIEAHRKGHSAIILESYRSTNVQLGDIISFGSNSSRIFSRWPGVPDQLDPICHKSKCLRYKTWTGEDIYTQWWGSDEENFGLIMRPPMMHRALTSSQANVIMGIVAKFTRSYSTTPSGKASRYGSVKR